MFLLTAIPEKIGCELPSSPIGHFPKAALAVVHLGPTKKNLATRGHSQSLVQPDLRQSGDDDASWQN